MPEEHVFWWNDGLRAALRLLEDQYDIHYINVDHTHSIHACEVNLVWGGSLSPQAQYGVGLPGKKYLLFGGGPIDAEILHTYDKVFVEDTWTLDKMRRNGIHTYFAFGTNTQLFKPMKLNKRWGAIYPAAFAKWKNHHVWVEAVKDKGYTTALAVGYIQPNGHESECYEVVEQAGYDVLPHVPPDVLVRMYNMSREVIITASDFGGCQRTVLEAMACDIPIATEYLNERLLSVYNKGLLTEKDYYDALVMHL